MEIINIFNYKKPSGKVFTQPSQTVPNQALSLKEIIERHSRGQDMDITYNPLYEEEPSSGVNVKTLDLEEIYSMKAENAEIIQELYTEKKKQDRDKHEKEQVEKFKKLAQEQLLIDKQKEKGAPEEPKK